MMQGGNANEICSETRQDEVGGIGVAYGMEDKYMGLNQEPQN